VSGQARRGAAAEIDIPPMPHWDDPGFRQIVCPGFDIAGSAARQLEGFNVSERHDGFAADCYSTVGNYAAGSDRAVPPGYLWLRHFDVHVPFTATLTIHFANPGERQVIMNCASPVSRTRTRLMVPIAWVKRTGCATVFLSDQH
jgi:hypothetical protein